MRKKKPVHWESIEQQTVIRYLKFKVPNANVTSSIAGVKVSMFTMQALKRCGYAPGTPDLMIFEPRKGYHGLFIEMKTGKTIYTERGKATSEQLEWQEKLKVRGYAAHICYGADEAIKIIDEYFSSEEHK